MDHDCALVSIAMTMTELYLKDIVRPPPTGSVPANVAHPFQTSFYTYLTKKFIPKHWYLVAGVTFTLTLYGTLDGLREAGKKKAYDDAVAAGRPPCELFGLHRLSSMVDDAC